MSIKKKLLKTLTWRITASLTTLFIVYIVSGEIKTAGIVTLLEGTIKMIIYYFHETIWEKIQLFKKDNKDNSSLK
ncbi:MAG: DUF2061 domain-containing protein [Maledivibacter sp.]|jgi:adenylylsulfate kinase|nr:DUF2061 domain-containing protein [Maledivibacter sp.]